MTGFASQIRFFIRSFVCSLESRVFEVRKLDCSHDVICCSFICGELLEFTKSCGVQQNQTQTQTRSELRLRRPGKSKRSENNAKQGDMTRQDETRHDTQQDETFCLCEKQHDNAQSSFCFQPTMLESRFRGNHEQKESEKVKKTKWWGHDGGNGQWTMDMMTSIKDTVQRPIEVPSRLPS